jgi:eukaryotic-like serine/threonine-protein kinase
VLRFTHMFNFLRGREVADETEPFRAGGQLAARYRPLEKLGEGGTGMVFRASRVNEPGSSVAVKVLIGPPRPPVWCSDPAVLTGLDHPRLVKVRACGVLDGAPYLEMEHVEGRTLRRAMSPGEAWPPADAAPVVLGIAEALAHLHGRGLLHLDLKPENVLCDPRGGVKLADLDGVVPRVVGRLTWERGSADYCAPEQRFGLAVDERADLFALAAVTYELVTGRLPGRVYLSCSKRVPSATAALDDALRAGLSRDPDGRPATMAGFARLLREALSP